LIEEAVTNGARKFKACEELGITVRTLQRWTQENGVKTDGRASAKRPSPANKLSEEERSQVLTLINSEAYKDCPPSQIVPALADQGEYIASESSFYRIMREDKQQQQH